MKKRNKEIEKLKPKIIEVLKRHKVKKAGIFGSYARGEQKKNSDVDVLIEPDAKASLFDVAGIELDLEKKLRRKVDVLTYKGIHVLLRKKILSEEVRVL